MFTAVHEIITKMAHHPHTVKINDPNHIVLIPEGFEDNDPFNRYQIDVSYEGTYFFIDVITEPGAFRLQDHVRRGYRNNQKPVTETKEKLKTQSWEMSVDLESDFRLTAVNYLLVQELPEVASEEAVKVGLELSNICLSYLNVIRIVDTPVVSAVHRNVHVQFNSDPWEVDPSERDKQTIEHRKMENWLIDKLLDNGIIALDPGYGDSSVQFDLAWKTSSDELVVCEVKTTANNEVKQIRLGVGQVLHYAIQMAKENQKVIPSLLVQTLPSDDTLIRLSEKAGVTIFSSDSNKIPTELIN